MGDKHLVRFEPVGIEIEVDEDQTILRAASEQGLQLMHGCKEGQCAACKSFVLEGEMDDIELEQVLDLRPARHGAGGGPDAPLPRPRLQRPRDRAPQLRRGDHPVGVCRCGRAPSRCWRTTPVTHDMRHLVVQAGRRRGHQVLPRPVHGLHRPRHRRGPVVLDGEHSRTARGVFEFVIKIYPDGAFSQFLEHKVAIGDRLEVEAPFGTCTLRENRTSDIVFIGGGAGMAPHAGPVARPRGEGRRPQGAPLLRRPHEGRPVLRGRIACPRGEDSRIQVRPCPVRPEGDGWDGGDGPDHGGGARTANRTSKAWTPMCADRRRWSTRRSHF